MDLRGRLSAWLDSHRWLAGRSGMSTPSRSGQPAAPDALVGAPQGGFHDRSVVGSRRRPAYACQRGRETCAER